MEDLKDITTRKINKYSVRVVKEQYVDFDIEACTEAEAKAIAECWACRDDVDWIDNTGLMHLTCHVKMNEEKR